MLNSIGLRQPLLGIASTLICISVSLTICAQFPPSTFGSWVALLIMSAIPLQVVIGLVWQGNYPRDLAGMDQPGKGIAIIGMMAVAAAVMTPVILTGVGGGLLPPTPFAVMYTIVSVCTAFWIVAAFQCWPMTAVSTHPAIIGLGVYALAYVSAWVVFHFGFDFGAMRGAPFYAVSLDPHGAFPAWNVLSYTVTTVSVIMWLVMLDFWPTATLATIFPALGRQPLFGLVSAALALSIAGAIWVLGVKVMGMDVVDYLVRVPVSACFGEFVMLVMMQTAPFQTMRQPLKGGLLLVLVVLLAMAMYRLYAVAATLLVGPLPSGAPTYDLDLWIATAMLSVTFPVFVAFGNGLSYWPLSRSRPAGR